MSNNNFLEIGYKFNITDGWTYTPAVDTNNSTISQPHIDLSSILPLKKTIKLKIELDFTWGDFTGSGTAGTFGAAFQGANRKIGATSDVWEGTNYITSALNSQASPTTLITNNITGGTRHYSAIATISSSWFNTYQGSILGFRTNYRRGAGSLSISNLKITLASLKDNNQVASISSIYTQGNQIYEY